EIWGYYTGYEQAMLKTYYFKPDMISVTKL
ncbi:MAG: hypothetical protein RLZZ218_931, partial [Actinomycetota bacterium]